MAGQLMSSILLISAAAAGVIAAPGQSTTNGTTQSPRLIVSKNFGSSNATMCVDAATTQAVPCTGAASQLFAFALTPTTTANTVSLGAISNDGKLCLDASANGGAVGNLIQQISCQTTGYTQKWIYHFGTSTIRPYYNLQLCIDATGGSGNLTGPTLVVNKCAPIASQQWVFM